jgi:coatomer subunit alpha
MFAFMFQACEKNPEDSETLDYDQHNPFQICGRSLRPIYQGRPEVTCPFCQTSYLPEFKGSVCDVCTVAEVGKEASGLKISSLQFSGHRN